MYSSIIQLLCLHTESFTRTVGNRMYTECKSCGHESNGITTGEHRYSNETYELMQRTKEMNIAHPA